MFGLRKARTNLRDAKARLSEVKFSDIKLSNLRKEHLKKPIVIKLIIAKAAIAVLITLVLASCATPTEQAIYRQQQYNSDAAKCESYGAAKASHDFIQCMATIEAGRQVVVRQSSPVFYPSIGYGRVW
jgi:hypothetical protein